MIAQILTKELRGSLTVKSRQINQVGTMCQSCEFGLHHLRIADERLTGCVCHILTGGGEPIAALLDGVHGLNQLLER